MSRWCKDCGSEIFGRSDKVFCDAACRSNFHNKRLSLEKKNCYSVDKILKRNRKLLLESVNKGLNLRKKIELSNQGFNFSYFTHQRRRKGKLTYYCYDIGYLEKDGDSVDLVYDQLILESK